jgi:hypothetical protein
VKRAGAFARVGARTVKKNGTGLQRRKSGAKKIGMPSAAAMPPRLTLNCCANKLFDRGKSRNGNRVCGMFKFEQRRLEIYMSII